MSRVFLVVTVIALSGTLGCTSRFPTHSPDGGPLRIADGPFALDAGYRDASSDAGPMPEPLVVVESGAPVDSASRFRPTEPATTAPEIVYPPDGVLVPPNLTGLELHFLPGSHDLFEIELRQRGTPSVVVYTLCDPLGSGCAYEPSSTVSDALAERRVFGSFEVVVRGVGGDEARVGESSPRVLTLADEPIYGGVYFWTIFPDSSAEQPSILRYDFERGARGPEMFLRPADAGASCVGCHALTRDGSRIAVGIDFPGDMYAVARTSTREIGPRRSGGMIAFSPSGNELVVGGFDSFAADTLSIVDAWTGDVIEDLEEVGSAPDWSPAGDAITFTNRHHTIGFYVHGAGGWQRRADWGWGASYPSFSPDARWIAYVDPHGRLGAARVDEGVARLLGRATADAPDTWPKWNPGVYYQAGSPLLWVCFSSQRDFGLLENADRRNQIWMAAFDPLAEGDPSYPAFRMPAQSWEARNFIPQWALRVERQPCEAPEDCPGGEFCQEGFCYPDVILE